MPEHKFSKAMELLLTLILISSAVLLAVSFRVPQKTLRLARNIDIHFSAAKIMKSCESFEISKMNDATIYYTEKDRQYVNMIHGILKTYSPLLQRDIDITRTEPVTLIIYPDKQQMLDAINYANPPKALPMGAYAAGKLIVLSPSYWTDAKNESESKDYFAANGPIIHELAHLYLDEKTNGNYKSWFSEGVALYYENKYTGYVWRQSSPRARAVTYKELNDNFKYINERESYRKSYEIINRIAEEKGEAVLKDIFNELSDGKSLDTALKKYFGDNLAIFDSL